MVEDEIVDKVRKYGLGYRRIELFEEYLAYTKAVIQIIEQFYKDEFIDDQLADYYVLVNNKLKELSIKTNIAYREPASILGSNFKDQISYLTIQNGKFVNSDSVEKDRNSFYSTILQYLKEIKGNIRKQVLLLKKEKVVDFENSILLEIKAYVKDKELVKDNLRIVFSNENQECLLS